MTAPRTLADLETPAAVVDLDRLAENLDRMAAYTTLHGLALRPHIKTHKATRIAADQLRLGASGLTCATPRELEVMSEVCDDLLLMHPPLGAKQRRVLALPPRVKLTVGIDSAAAVESLAQAAGEEGREIDVLIEVDVGMRRVGVQTPAEAVGLARLVARNRPLRYRGIAFYPGHVREPVDQQDEKLENLTRDIERYGDALSRAGLPPRVVSGGSTPAAWHMHRVPGMTEVRPGTYVYNDRVTAAIGACGWDDCALTVLATVISTAVPEQAVIDAGSKALGREPMRGADGEGFGALLDRRDVVVKAMSEEHGILDLSRTSWRPEVGEQVRVIPNHVCVVVHLNDVIHGARETVIETSWPVEARGR